MSHRFAILTATWLLGWAGYAIAADPIARVLPPPGIELPVDQRQQIERRLREVMGRVQSQLDHPLLADAAVAIKAVDLALRHGEFYQPQDANKALRILQLADDRIRQLAVGSTPWTSQRGRVVRGFRSRVDDSFQPYGLVIPEDLNLSRPVPLYVWLHGRGDKQTDLHFLAERLDKDGQIRPPAAIVLHPFGRQCVGYKSAGETDVLEAIEHVQSQYRIDPDRIVLMGFSMGGAGAWHLGAHDTDRFVAISTGAGFAETARYTNLKPENNPPPYEQRLWGVYDVPNYTRNLFNRPVIAYSGELDKQIQAARVMEDAFREHGRELTHLIGPGMGHKYHPETLTDILRRLDEFVRQGKPELPRQVFLQTRTLRYHRMDWVEALGLQQHWCDSRIDAEISGERKLRVTTLNVSKCRFTPWESMAGVEIEIDGQRLVAPAEVRDGASLVRRDAWEFETSTTEPASLAKRPGLQGPMDDVFLEPFLVVLPSGKAPNKPVQEWVDSELDHFRQRWRGVMRGELRIRQDTDVTAEDLARYHLVVWGTPRSNSILQRALAATPHPIPLKWTVESVVLGKHSLPARHHVPLFVYPNPLNPQRYLVVNTGPTFREAHDRTNAMQNPKLPDWAIVDLTQPPDANSPGRIVAADFFDEQWQLKTPH